MFLKKILELVMRIVLNLNIKYKGDDVIVTPTSTSTPIVTPTPTITSTPIVTPTSPSTGVIQYTNQFYDGLLKGLVVLESGKTYRVDYIKSTQISTKLRIKTTGAAPATLIIGVENYSHKSTIRQDSHLFFLNDGADILINNVNFCSPPQLKTSQPWTPSFVSSKTDSKIKWSFIVKNCDTTVNGLNPGWGVGFVYGSERENIVGLYNFKHCGPGLIDAKNPFPNSTLHWVTKNVETYYPSREEFGSSRILTTGKIENGTFTINDPKVETDCFYENYAFGDFMDRTNNFCFIIHIGRYTFEWDGKSKNITNKSVLLRPYPKGIVKARVLGGRLFLLDYCEVHAGDQFRYQGQVYTVTMKSRTEYGEWSIFEPAPAIDINRRHALSTDKVLPEGYIDVEWISTAPTLTDQPVWLVYKGNQFYRSYQNTQFGNQEIISAEINGHLCYNHANISIDANNTNLNGFYRQSTADVNSTAPKYMNIVNSTGFDDQFNPSFTVNSVVIPVNITNDNNFKSIIDFETIS